MQMVFFSFSEYWWFYLSFTAFVCVMLLLDLGVFHKTAHVISVKEAALWSAFWIGISLIFSYGFYHYTLYKLQNSVEFAALPGFDAVVEAKRLNLEFLTGYVIEKALAVDNIFIFVMVFAAFGIPLKYQHRVLFFGILGALVFRSIFISIGSSLMKYHWVLILFGVFLIITGIKMLFISAKPTDPAHSWQMRILQKFTNVTTDFDGHKLFIKKNGIRYATPLFVALFFIELSDIVFALDSVPAIFAITKEPMIVFTSNILAILGLRSLYFLLAGVVDRFIYLKYGLALVLIFVGMKMTFLNKLYGGKFPTGWALLIIALLISSSILISLFVTKKTKMEN